MENPTVKVTVEVTPVQVEQIAPQITQPTNNVGNSLVGKVLAFHITRPPVMLAENEVVTLSDDPDAYTLVHNPRYDISVPEEYQGCLVFDMIAPNTVILTDKIEIANFTDEEKNNNTFAINAIRNYLILSDPIVKGSSISIEHSAEVLPERLFVRKIKPKFTDISFTGKVYQTEYGSFLIAKDDVKILNGSEEVTLTGSDFALSDKYGNFLNEETINEVTYLSYNGNADSTLSLSVGLPYRPFFTKEFTVTSKIQLNTPPI